jgi:guanine deaminase
VISLIFNDSKKRAIKGTFIYTATKEAFTVKEGYLVMQDGLSLGVKSELDDPCIEVHDYTGYLVIPGLIDLHLHAPQYPICANGMDLELLDWLETYTFPQEAKFSDPAYANDIYPVFVKEITDSYTTRACIFGTIHEEANFILMDHLEASGLIAYVGKVNMDRHAPAYLIEADAKTSLEETKLWLEASRERYQRTKPIITPRFIPVCSDELMHGLGELKKTFQVPYQSHLSENASEIQWIGDLCPESKSYTDAYLKRGAFGVESSTIMAHCIHLSEEEERVLKQNKVYIAHCPDSNINLSSGIAPIRRYINQQQFVGLGSDIAGGASLDMFYVMRSAIQSSKMYEKYVDENDVALKLEEVFYLATKGGGAFFGQVGSFEPGYEVDAVILKDFDRHAHKTLTPIQRLEN